jgi:hypothetical protein
VYVYLEGAWHPIADDEHTPCGLVVPHGTEWATETPEVIHCGPNATKKPEPVKAKAKK